MVVATPESVYLMNAVLMLLICPFSLRFVQAQRLKRSKRIIAFYFIIWIEVHDVSTDEVQFYVAFAHWVFYEHVVNRHDDTQCAQIERSEESAVGIVNLCFKAFP
jgi:hypothetical protein